jgi:hypothetical protein
MRTKKVFINLLSSVFLQMVSIVVGLIIPKLIIATYGSTFNGLISSTNQIVGYFGIIEGGVAAAAGASLYKPFAEKDYTKINNIMTAVKNFYQKTGIIIGFIVTLLCIIYPLSIKNQINFSKASFVMIMLSLISVLGYLVFNKYNMILVTDQKHYITLISSAIVNLLICFLQMVLMLNKINVIFVCLVVPACSIIRLFIIRGYIRKNYSFINYHGEPEYQGISQKWNALSMNISQLCKVAIPIVVLSLMYDLKVVSVYTVYSLLFHVGSSMLEISGNSITAIFGNVVAKENQDIIKRSYDISETLTVMVIAILSGCFFCLTEPFIHVYVGNVNDINYSAPLLTISFIINEAIINLRFSPKISIKAVGKLREARNSGLAEIVMCSILTPLCCLLYGYQGVLFGSILSGFIQTVYLTKVSYSKILREPVRDLYKKIIVNTMAFILGIITIRQFISYQVSSYFDWFLFAVITGIIIGLFVFVSNFIFLKKNLKPLLAQIKVLFKK